MKLLESAVVAALCLVASEAAAQESIISEIRGGLSFEGVVLDDDFLMFPTNIPITRPHKLSAEILFAPPDIELLKWIGSPRPVIGATVSLTGLESWASAGLSWHAPFFDSPLFVEATLGGAIHTGHLFDAPAGQPNFGCRALIYEQITLGTNITDSVTASINFEHGSHAWLCGQTNDGFNSVGFRLGYKF